VKVELWVEVAKAREASSIGKKVCQIFIITHTSLVGVGDRRWCRIPRRIATFSEVEDGNRSTGVCERSTDSIIILDLHPQTVERCLWTVDRYARFQRDKGFNAVIGRTGPHSRSTE